MTVVLWKYRAVPLRDTKPTCKNSKETAKIAVVGFTDWVRPHGQQIVF